MDAALPAPREVSVEKKPPTFGTVSLVFAVLTIILPLVTLLFFGQKAAQEERANAQGGLAGFLVVIIGVFFSAIVSGLSSLLGTLAAVVALARGERQTWRPIVGLIVNVPVLAVVAYTAIAIRSSTG